MKKISIAIIAILCVISILFAFGACQNGGDDATPSGQPSGNAPSVSIDSGESIPSGSIDSGSIDSGDTAPSGSVDSGEVPSGEPSPDLPSGEIESGDIGSGEQPPEPVYVKSITDLVENYSDIVYSALNDTFLESAGKSAFGSRVFNAENIVSVSWDVGTSDTISEIKFVATYANSDTDYTYGISSIQLNETIKIQDLNKDNITSTINNSTANAVRGYTFRYDPTIQSDRADLTKAICDKLFGENESATRYIVDVTSTLDTMGEARQFKVIEITNVDVKENTINIKSSSNDEGYIANLENPSYYRTVNENYYTLSGNKITQ